MERDEAQAARLLARRLFREQVDRPDDEIDLARAALLIAKEEYPWLDPDIYLSRLSAMAREVEGRLPPGATPAERVQALGAYLFEELGFVGSTRDHDDPRNSFLNDVLDRRTGIPITLSLVYAEIGRRLGLNVAGIRLPGHFVVRVEGLEERPYVDPFEGGRRLSVVGCQELVAQRQGESASLRPEQLQPATRRQILARMLGNLKAISARSGDDERTLAAIDRLLILQPDAPIELRDRAYLNIRRRRFVPAQGDLHHYLRLVPNAPDAEQVERHLAALHQTIGRLN